VGGGADVRGEGSVDGCSEFGGVGAEGEGALGGEALPAGGAVGDGAEGGVTRSGEVGAVAGGGARRRLGPAVTDGGGCRLLVGSSMMRSGGTPACRAVSRCTCPVTTARTAPGEAAMAS
jgi:hypothetical protein